MSISLWVVVEFNLFFFFFFIEAVEHACGMANLQMGEFVSNVANGIDTYSIREPLGVCAGICPYEFPAMIPLWVCLLFYFLPDCFLCSFTYFFYFFSFGLSDCLECHSVYLKNYSSLISINCVVFTVFRQISKPNWCWNFSDYLHFMMSIKMLVYATLSF